MGVNESKLHTKKIEKHLIQCPIETTEIIASDCESLYNTEVIKSCPFSFNTLNTLSSRPSVETLNNTSVYKSCDFNGKEYGNEEIWLEKQLYIKDTKEEDNYFKPKIHKLNSEVELLDNGFSDEEQVDEFSTSDSDKNDSSCTESRTSSRGSNSTEKSSSPPPSSSSSSSGCHNSEQTSQCSTNSIKCEFGFNKHFIKNFKERYSSGISEQYRYANDSISHKNDFDYDESFTEITKIIPDDCKKAELGFQNYVTSDIYDNSQSQNSLSNSMSTDSDLCIEQQPKSLPTSKGDVSQDYSTAVKRVVHSSLESKLTNLKAGLRCLCYKFWVDATYETWKVFHNGRDRRIESIGRLSNCQIRLTKITQRNPKGMLKRLVCVYASTLADLEKCCKLFDDKFPQFCASSNLNIENSVNVRN